MVYFTHARSTKRLFFYRSPHRRDHFFSGSAYSHRFPANYFRQFRLQSKFFSVEPVITGQDRRTQKLSFYRGGTGPNVVRSNTQCQFGMDAAHGRTFIGDRLGHTRWNLSTPVANRTRSAVFGNEINRSQNQVVRSWQQGTSNWPQNCKISGVILWHKKPGIITKEGLL